MWTTLVPSDMNQAWKNYDYANKCPKDIVKEFIKRNFISKI